MVVRIPYKFVPRTYQMEVFKAIDRGIKRLCLLWHRRAGKDKTAVNIIARAAMERVGAYYYLFPTYKQGKKVIWTGIGKDGFKFLDHFPAEIVNKKNETDMRVEFVNGSFVQVIGTDDIDSIMGSNPVGVVFSEYSLQNPQAWDLIRPILKENGGFAIFIYTPRGKNHGYKLYQMAKKNANWFTQLLTINDTKVLSLADIDEEREEGMGEELIQQEYFCSFEAGTEGNYYGKQMKKAEADGRIGNVTYEKGLPVHTAWDLGIGDSTAIWFYQQVGKEVRLIDYYEANGEGLAHYAKVLQDRGYVYGSHYAPHDIAVRELGTGKSRIEVARSLGINFLIVRKLGIDDGIEAVRNLLDKCWFDEEKCEHGINALNSYHKEYDDKRKMYKTHPDHDWASHPADAFRYLSVSCREQVEKSEVVNPMPESPGGTWMGN